MLTLNVTLTSTGEVSRITELWRSVRFSCSERAAETNYGREPSRGALRQGVRDHLEVLDQGVVGGRSRLVWRTEDCRGVGGGQHPRLVRRVLVVVRGAVVAGLRLRHARRTPGDELAAVLGDPERGRDERLGRGRAEADDDLRL